MKIDKILPDLDTEERLDAEMQEEIDMHNQHLKRYFRNIESLYDKKRCKEIKKSIIEYTLNHL